MDNFAIDRFYPQVYPLPEIRIRCFTGSVNKRVLAEIEKFKPTRIRGGRSAPLSQR
jgi:hypothetical protein